MPKRRPEPQGHQRRQGRGHLSSGYILACGPCASLPLLLCLPEIAPAWDLTSPRLSPQARGCTYLLQLIHPHPPPPPPPPLTLTLTTSSTPTTVLSRLHSIPSVYSSDTHAHRHSQPHTPGTSLTHNKRTYVPFVHTVTQAQRPHTNPLITCHQLTHGLLTPANGWSFFLFVAWIHQLPQRMALEPCSWPLALDGPVPGHTDACLLSQWHPHPRVFAGRLLVSYLFPSRLVPSRSFSTPPSSDLPSSIPLFLYSSTLGNPPFSPPWEHRASFVSPMAFYLRRWPLARSDMPSIAVHPPSCRLMQAAL
ncbi:hypothetical protein EDB81DRAFT_223941 [Dactylonectria macrodidyma]|uniref:Uncharacterized protein n=1 Tax=Dactylonectria macrodidyma TaxID=307937 RepID=A0A9P9DNW7_9HYPO|nr:hypothetical protein EDB81DRAFT_223941 [Dactylonectria macrodidyma]